MQGTTPVLQHDYSFDSATARISGVTSTSGGSVAYSYLADSDLLATTTFGGGQAVTTRSWDYGVRLGSIQNTLGGSVVTSHAYQYDSVNRRWRVTREDGSRWDYGYNDRNEVTSGKHYSADGTPVSGEQFEYSYDNIGNRTSARWGGDINGLNLRQTTYTPNNLNQYATITTEGYQHITGAAAGATVMVAGANGISGGGTADRKGSYFSREVNVANSTGPVWGDVNVTAGAALPIKHLLYPPQTQSAASANALTNDLDGNLKSDGLWIYTWDAENRLIQMTSAAQVPDPGKRQIDFRYDHLGRRFKKTVRTYSGGAYGNAVTSRFLHDGWRLVAELNGTTVQRSYTWGKDLSGKIDEAGGVGGLVIVTDHLSNPVAVYSPSYDGNGNVAGLLKSGGGTVGARYEYGPFGELFRASGPMARLNSVRWSSKYSDEETTLNYYGYRYYSAVSGRWLNRDPIGEGGGINLLGFARNAPVLFVDRDGQIIPILIGIGIASGIGAFVGAISSPNDPLFGALKGGAVGGIGAGVGVLAGAGLAAGAAWAGVELPGSLAVMAGGGAAAGTSQFLGYAADNYLAGADNPFSLTTRQGIMTGLASATGVFTGAFIVGQLARKGFDIDTIDEAVLDASISIAGSIGIGLADVFSYGAEMGMDALRKIGTTHVDRLNQAGEP